MAQSRNTPNSGPNSRPVKSGLSGQRDDPYQWAGKIGMEGTGIPSGRVRLARQRSMAWTVTPEHMTEWSHSEPRNCLRPEAGYGKT